MARLPPDHEPLDEGRDLSRVFIQQAARAHRCRVDGRQGRSSTTIKHSIRKGVGLPRGTPINSGR
jgi:hypothetical protein